MRLAERPNFWIMAQIQPNFIVTIKCQKFCRTNIKGQFFLGQTLFKKVKFVVLAANWPNGNTETNQHEYVHRCHINVCTIYRVPYQILVRAIASDGVKEVEVILPPSKYIKGDKDVSASEILAFHGKSWAKKHGMIDLGSNHVLVWFFFQDYYPV
jgi:hypothetical protein